MTAFELAVDAVLRGLDVGAVVTYSEVAVEAGWSWRAGRAVGGMLSRHGDEYPWWRVVTVDGRLVPGHEREHARRLRAEGVKVVDGRVTRMAARRPARERAAARHTGRPARVPGGPRVDLRP